MFKLIGAIFKNTIRLVVLALRLFIGAIRWFIGMFNYY